VEQPLGISYQHNGRIQVPSFSAEQPFRRSNSFYRQRKRAASGNNYFSSKGKNNFANIYKGRKMVETPVFPFRAAVGNHLQGRIAGLVR